MVCNTYWFIYNLEKIAVRNKEDLNAFIIFI
jgi:hypothetical protein